ncbi:MAG TPA: ABC transporter permease [Pilimelia sp.]|nr:ABC transporter permease [Pilimelia sp.]
MSDVESVAAAERVDEPSGPSGGRHAAKRAKAAKPRSLAADAWRDLRRNWVFWVSAALVLVIVVIAVFPGLFVDNDGKDCALSRQYGRPEGGAIFGFNFQGCDIYARAIYGAQPSILVGVGATLISAVIGAFFGMTSGYFGGWVDAVLSRMVDIVLAIPLLLAAIVFAKGLNPTREGTGIGTVVIVLGVLNWTTAARVMRSSVIAAKSQDFVAAARMLGAGPGRIMFRHILPNSVAPFIVVLTILLGINIATEAALSFLGVGLNPNQVSWGGDISHAAIRVQEAATPLVVPSAFLALTVLSFIMLGDAVRDAFDPRLR